MWIPKTEDELRAAAANAGLIASDVFDAKAELPWNPLVLAIDAASVQQGRAA